MSIEKLFINKYYPKNIDSFELDHDLKDILKLLLKIDTINILFIGNSCTGKTTLIKTIVNLYFDNNMKDINENTLNITCLKDQGINFYRNEVKVFCQTNCLIKNKKKIVILDDIDIINEQSQQVFRNCLDKYNSNVHFIASCNNIQKVIDSFQSRQIIIKLKPLKKEYIENIYNNIVKKESLTIDDESKDFILKISQNSPRILINYLEKLKLLNTNIDINIAMDNCSNINYEDLINYTNNCKANNLKLAINQIYSIFKKGFSVMDILDNYYQYIKQTNIISEDEKYLVIQLLCKYITIFHNIHEDEIELALFTNNLIRLLKK